jgi:hypothetical protein
VAVSTNILLIVSVLHYAYIPCANSMRAAQAGYGRSAMERLMLNGAPYTPLQVHYTYIHHTILNYFTLMHLIVSKTGVEQLCA